MPATDHVDLTRWLRPGDGVVWSQACAEPTPLVHALLDQAPDIGGLRAFCGMSLDPRLADGPHEGLEVWSYGALGRLGRLADRGGLQVLPAHFSTIPGLFERREVPVDVALIQVSPADADGLHTLGVGVDYVAEALPHARHVIAEVNAQMPATRGGPRLPASTFSHVLHTDRPVVELSSKPVGDVEQLIATHVADLVADGDTIQTGVGALPTAVLAQLKGHHDLGMHSGMVSDGVLDLIEAGVLTGARKPLDPGLVVTGAALGSRRLYDALPDLPVRFASVRTTHAADVLSRVGPLVSVNGAIEVDLTGQVNAETADGRYRGAAGGQVDFCRAATLGEGRSVIALRATARDGRSRIVPRLADGVVTTPRTDVEFVVTEHGVADLRGRSLVQRARALIQVAAPEHRDQLRHDARLL